MALLINGELMGDQKTTRRREVIIRHVRNSGKSRQFCDAMTLRLIRHDSRRAINGILNFMMYFYYQSTKPVGLYGRKEK